MGGIEYVFRTLCYSNFISIMRGESDYVELRCPSCVWCIVYNEHDIYTYAHP